MLCAPSGYDLPRVLAPFFLGGCRAIPADGNRCPAPISGSEPSPPVWGPPRGLLRGWHSRFFCSPFGLLARYQYEPGHACCALLEAGRPRAGRSRFARSAVTPCPRRESKSRPSSPHTAGSSADRRLLSARGKRDCTTVNEEETQVIEAAGVLVVTTDASAVLYTPAGANRWF